MFNENKRAKILDSPNVVDYVVITFSDAVNIINEVKLIYIVKALNIPLFQNTIIKHNE